MSVSRLKYITKIGVEQMGDLADSLEDTEVLRFENLDTDLRPPQSALDYTKNAVDEDDAKSYLPFFGLTPLSKHPARSAETIAWSAFFFPGRPLPVHHSMHLLEAVSKPICASVTY